MTPGEKKLLKLAWEYRAAWARLRRLKRRGKMTKEDREETLDAELAVLTACTKLRG